MKTNDKIVDRLWGAKNVLSVIRKHETILKEKTPFISKTQRKFNIDATK
jgi:hypothetical protein